MELDFFFFILFYLFIFILFFHPKHFYFTEIPRKSVWSQGFRRYKEFEINWVFSCCNVTTPLLATKGHVVIERD
jgi:hypothetical protein